MAFFDMTGFSPEERAARFPEICAGGVSVTSFCNVAVVEMGLEWTPPTRTRILKVCDTERRETNFTPSCAREPSLVSGGSATDRGAGNYLIFSGIAVSRESRFPVRSGRNPSDRDQIRRRIILYRRDLALRSASDDPCGLAGGGSRRQLRRQGDLPQRTVWPDALAPKPCFRPRRSRRLDPSRGAVRVHRGMRLGERRGADRGRAGAFVGHRKAICGTGTGLEGHAQGDRLPPCAWSIWTRRCAAVGADPAG